MNIKDRLIKKLLGGTIEKQVEERLNAAVDQRLLTALPAALQEKLQAASLSLNDEYGWRLLSGQNTRQLLIAPYEAQILTAYWLYKTNPLAGFLIDTQAAFIAAEATPFECDNDDVKDLLTAFWDRNRLHLRWGNYLQELGVFGNIVLSAHVARQTGRVKLGYIDPGLIISTVPDPEDVQTKIGVILMATEQHKKRTLKVILDRDTEEDLSPQAQRLREQMVDGQCFLLQINCMSSELLGTSDLFNIADHLEAYEQMMMDSAEKYAQYNAFYYDVTVEGADNEELEKNRRLYSPPRTGGSFIHNEKIRSVPVAPSLQANDSESASRFHRRHILGAKGMPNHWYADPEGSNRATADAMDRPTLKRFEKRQAHAKGVLNTIADFVISSAMDARYLNVPEDEAYDYEISTPPLSDKDVAKLSTMLRDVSTSLTVAQNSRWIDQKDAARMFAFCTAMLGFEYNPDEVSDIPPEGTDYTNGETAPVEPEEGTEAAIPRTGARKGP